MNEVGAVSAWVGNASSGEVFDSAHSVSFSDDGDFLGSAFSRAFNIGYYDEGFREAGYRDIPARNLTDLLEGASYPEVVIPRLQGGLPGPLVANCFVLLYDYRHAGPHSWTGEGLFLGFIGTAAYQF